MDGLYIGDFIFYGFAKLVSVQVSCLGTCGARYQEKISSQCFRGFVEPFEPIDDDVHYSNGFFNALSF